MADSSKILLFGGLAVGAFLLLRDSGTGSGSIVPSLSSLLPGSLEQSNQPVQQIENPARPVIPGAPILEPPIFNATYYLQYQYPALYQINPGIANPNYQLTAQDAQNYVTNYLEVNQWYNNDPAVAKRFKGNLQAAMQFHFSTYGVAMDYSFVPFTPPKNASWVPPPPNPKSSGGGIWRSIAQVATTVAGGVLTVASGGALAPIIAPVTAAVVKAEGAINGISDETVVLNDTEINIINTSAAIIKKILPFYLKSQKSLVDSIDLKLNNIISTYAP